MDVIPVTDLSRDWRGSCEYDLRCDGIGFRPLGVQRLRRRLRGARDCHSYADALIRGRRVGRFLIYTEAHTMERVSWKATCRRRAHRLIFNLVLVMRSRS